MKNKMDFENKIKELKIKLPDAKPPVGSYVATKIVDNLLYISGQISISENGELIKGKVGKDLSVDDGYKAAERCGLGIISQAKVACNGDLSKIKYYDPTGSKKEFKKLKNVEFSNSLQESIIGSDIVIIHTDWNDFKSINFKKFSKNKKLIIYDMRNIYSPNKIKKLGFKYFGIGR